MKITAEFNSTEDILEFINAFGGQSTIRMEGATIIQSVEKVNYLKEEKKSVATDQKETKKVDKIEVPKVEVEEPEPVNEIYQGGKVQEAVKITKEQVRAKFTQLAKNGKSEDAKKLLAKYGVGKVTEIKEEDYAAIIKEVEELL